MLPPTSAFYRKSAACLFTLLICLMLAAAASAHAELERSEPAANAVLHNSPPEIRLWFTEPLETAFSRIHLFDSRGQEVTLPAAQVAPENAHQLFVPLPPLASGTYTVNWSALSSADGHATRGSYSFSIGAGGSAALQFRQPETLSGTQALIRGFNLLALSLGIGSIGFLLWVWAPSQNGSAAPDYRPYGLISFSAVSWLLIGVASIMLLLMQASIYSGVPLSSALPGDTVATTLTATRFGSLWMARIILWMMLGVTLWLSRKRPALMWGAFGLGAGILLTQSLFSHASAAEDAVAAIASDWLHLTGAVLWFGGIAAFALALASVRKHQDRAQTASLLTGHFSDMGRASMVMLALSGFYAALLQVGSWEALTTTPYGRALLVKLILFAPLLLIAAINLLKTRKELNRGNAAWFGRLRGLIGVEIALALGIFAAVGVMTSLEPARSAAESQPPVSSVPNQPFFEMQIVDGLMAHLEIEPGSIGSNAFIVMLFDENGSPVTDASLIRLRFTPPNPSIGRSELRPEAVGDGVYRIEGSNLSIPGEWQIRMTVQRPQEFDTLYDFTITVSAPDAETSANPEALLLTTAGIAFGLFTLALGGYWCARNSVNLRTGKVAIGLAGCIAGLVMALSSAAALAQFL